MNVRGIGVSYARAMTMQAVSTVFAIGAVFFAYRYRKNAEPQLLSALFFAARFAPFLTCCPTTGDHHLSRRHVARRRPLDAPARRIAKLVYWLPLIQMIFGQYHIPGPALILPAFAVFPAAATCTAGQGSRISRGNRPSTTRFRCRVDLLDLGGSLPCRSASRIFMNCSNIAETTARNLHAC